MKIAIDSVGREWHAKPVGFVSYGGMSGGLRAVEQLRIVFAELHTVTIRETVSFHGAHAQFDEHGAPREPAAVNTAVGALLDQLAWWAHPLQYARAALIPTPPKKGRASHLKDSPISPISPRIEGMDPLRRWRGGEQVAHN